MKPLLILILCLSVAEGQEKAKISKLDSSMRNYFTTSPEYVIKQPLSEIVFTIDSAKVVTVPKGWEYIIVVKGGNVWAADSSLKNLSHPKFW